VVRADPVRRRLSLLVPTAAGGLHDSVPVYHITEELEPFKRCTPCRRSVKEELKTGYHLRRGKEMICPTDKRH
jgi:hypothetical protein